MDLITFRCSSCNQGLKLPAEHAGRKVKCTKCGTSLTVPAKSQSDKPVKRRKAYEEDPDDDGVGTYGFGEKEESATTKDVERSQVKKRREEEDEDDDDELDAEEREEADDALRRRLAGEDEEKEEDDEYEDDEDRPKKKHQPRAKLDVNAYQKVRVGLMMAVIGISLLAGSVLLHKIYIMIGMTSGQNYAEIVNEVHPHYKNPPDETTKVDLLQLMVSLIGGLKAYSANKALLIVGQIFVLLQGVMTIVACVFFLSVPPRFGAKGVAITALVMAAVNLILGVVFKFLPLAGAMKFVLLPLFGAELAMSGSNADRIDPIHLTWCGLPYLQVFLTVFIIVLSYGELILIPLLLRAVAIQLKAEQLENSCNSLVQLSLAQVFIQMAYQLMAMTGTSNVLSVVLKVFYIFGLFFFIWQLTWYILILIRGRSVIQRALEKELEE